MKEQPTDKATERSERSLHICPACESSLVQPTYWEQQDDRSQWRIWRRCPECEWTSNSIHGGGEIDAFDEQLDHGAHELAGELRSLEHANMSAMAAAFIIALDNDLITADDFA
ncbi:MAG TPA: hypothetical protein VFT79_12020 [Solirubrobacterales bacterium]|nr:hypothetical protein [Solirubrobacterales bacterium]